MNTIEELRDQAEELGIEVDGRWKESRLQEEIDKAREGGSEAQDTTSEPEPEPEAEPEASGDTYKNVSRCAQSLFGVRVMPGKSYILTEQNHDDKKGMARLDRAVSVFGFFEKV